MPLPFALKNLGGEPHCCDACTHLDCAEIRANIGKPCAGCSKPLRRGDTYNYFPDASPGHQECVLDAMFPHRLAEDE